MQPGVVEALNGIKKVMLEVLLPELQSAQARGQVLYAGVLLDHLAARWEIEYPLLAEERADLSSLLAEARERLGGSAAELERRIDALLGPAEPGAGQVPGPAQLVSDNAAMREVVAALVSRSSLPEPMAASLHAYLRRQHHRDERLVAVGALSW